MIGRLIQLWDRLVKACLVTLTDRKSRYLLCKKIAKKNSFLVKQAMIKLLENQPLETITPDRGKEFSKHAEISQELNLVEFYFPFPHHPLAKRNQRKTPMDCLENISRKLWILINQIAMLKQKMKEINLRRANA